MEVAMSSAITPRVSEISEGEDIAETNQHRAPHKYLIRSDF